MNPKSIKIVNYKCFNNVCGFDSIANFNLVIGKNNIGKSSLVDSITFFYNRNVPPNVSLIVEFEITEELYTNFFFERLKSSYYAIEYSLDIRMYLGKSFFITFGHPFSFNQVGSSDVDLNRVFIKFFNSTTTQQFLDYFFNSNGNTCAIRLSAERDIEPEPHNIMENFSSSGRYATQFVINVLNNNRFDSSLIQQNVVKAFNEIMGPDLKIDNITTKYEETSRNWEIHIMVGNQSIPLSQSGSGLKTVILVLLQLIVIPKITTNYDRFIYIFEELENNLHPNTQRKLLNYIYKHSLRSESVIFCTTHSNIAIDLLLKKEKALLFLLKKDTDQLCLQTVDNHNSICSVFEELDIRASDLIQTNAVIWVEGPSDRVYINKWMSLINPELVEGIHYNFFYYGGKLISHYSVNLAETLEKLDVLKLNRNSIIWMDSDRKSKLDKVNPTKKRIELECKDSNILCHITYNREIENYIPVTAFQKYYDNPNLLPLDRFEDIKNYLNRIKKNEGKKFEENKVRYAKEFIQHVKIDDLKQDRNLYKVVNQMVTKIIKWNSIE